MGQDGIPNNPGLTVNGNAGDHSSPTSYAQHSGLEKSYVYLQELLVTLKGHYHLPTSNFAGLDSTFPIWFSTQHW